MKSQITQNLIFFKFQIFQIVRKKEEDIYNTIATIDYQTYTIYIANFSLKIQLI